MRKAKTMKVSGGDYAKVAERLRLFREDCPHGLIETSIVSNDEQVIFKARVVKDKSDPSSAEATGHAVGSVKGIKAYEKQESIAVGRALALLGYLASGEIASSEEMEEFEDFKRNKELEKQDRINSNRGMMKEMKTLNELKAFYTSLDPEMQIALKSDKDELKSKLQ